MPIYEYECYNCKKRFEVMQKFNDIPLDTCPKCGGRLHKLISNTSFILKGSGWYVTDYARQEKKKQKEPETKQTKRSDTTTDSKTGKVKSTPKN